MTDEMQHMISENPTVAALAAARETVWTNPRLRPFCARRGERSLPAYLLTVPPHGGLSDD